MYPQRGTLTFAYYRGSDYFVWIPNFCSCLGKSELVFVLIVHLFFSYAHVNLRHFFSSFMMSGVGCDFCLWPFPAIFVYLFEFRYFLVVEVLSTIFMGIPIWASVFLDMSFPTAVFFFFCFLLLFFFFFFLYQFKNVYFMVFLLYKVH